MLFYLLRRQHEVRQWRRLDAGDDAPKPLEPHHIV